MRLNERDCGMGTLFICGTPIGNLEDVSIRLLKTLRKVDIIACEDTRHTLKLLNHYKIKNRLLSYHEFSSKNKEDLLLNELKAGKDIALVSDAGMPLISDPGSNLIKRAVEIGIDLEVVPGPSACTAALALSGLDNSSFIFMGFPPAHHSQRRKFLQAFQDELRTVILYEAPHRLLATLEDINALLGPDRTVVIAREISKKYQEIKRGRAEEIYSYYTDSPPRGEICLLLGAAEREKEAKSIDAILLEIDEMIEKGMAKKEAFKIKAHEYGVAKSIIYKRFIERDT